MGVEVGGMVIRLVSGCEGQWDGRGFQLDGSISK